MPHYGQYSLQKVAHKSRKLFYYADNNEYMVNPAGWAIAALYNLRGYERIEGEQRRNLDKLSAEVDPYEIWMKEGYGLKATFGNIIIGNEESEELNRSELEAVFLHEVGHVGDKATLKITILSIIGAAVSAILGIITLILISGTARALDLHSVAHLVEHQFVVQGVFLLSILAGVDLTLRRQYPEFEYRADRYSAKKGYGNELISVMNAEFDYEEGWLLKIQNHIRRRYYPSIESRIEKIKMHS